MTKRTKVLSGEAARKYFRALFTADPGQTPASAARLADTCVREIAEMRVRLPLVASRTALLANVAPLAPVEPVPTPAENQPPAAETTPPQIVEPPPVAELTVGKPPAEPAFDPFAFSLIVAFRRDGKAALLARLIAIGDAGRLKDIAKAQHVGIPADADSIETLAAAIVAGTERRVAHREAAAS